ncbi:alanine racemase [Tepiditoga spiralis]|uniref:Alanine racemase n=1 Tax=Tepiditoga spiralis TaxID=2108365 RepID=A0A7G1G4C1_9BACT|nr:alanine/ornithine racemase family PLP-dependent enzyme [Tepiditoga spiralis]BBE31348.1 alanine racemase [Tepiditoga spiralis]
MYPKMYIYKNRIKENAIALKNICSKKNIKISGVTKVLCGNPEVAEALKEAGIDFIGDSRISNIKKMKNFGINTEFMLLRIPMISEIEELIKYVDITLISELETLKKISEQSIKYNKIQKVIYMVDVGDLREGVWYESAINEIEEALTIKNIKVIGIGTNLGCFGGVIPTKENMNLLVSIKNKIEEKNNIKFELISGGNTAALPLIENNELPNEINNFRLGESIICGTDVTNNKKVLGARQDTVILEAEIIELKEKPSIPVGKIGFDAFGRVPHFEDKGIRTKAILAIGEQDISPSGLYPLDEDIEVLHSSSDHTIVDLTNSKNNYKIGDTIKFKMSYGCMLKASTSQYVEKIVIK